ncbi:SDR family NAD(P)-dependent oxidoreductase [Nocardia sp. NPDC003963]
MSDPLIPTDISKKTIVITGASAGIGAAAARRLAAAGATVVAVGRSPERTAAVAAELGTEPVVADFADLGQVRCAAGKLLERYPRIDVLANNAGGVFPERVETVDGHELSFQANHLAGFLLTQLLLPRLRETAQETDVRVIATSSFANRFAKVRIDDLEWTHRRYGNGWLVYCATKLMNIMTTRQLAQHTSGTGISALSFHPEPGADAVPGDNNAADTTATNFAHDTWMMRLFQRIPGLRSQQLTGAQGSQPLVWLASGPQVPDYSGIYFDGMTPHGSMNRQASNPDIAQQLWDRSMEMVGAYL